MIALDTNLLVYAHRSGLPEHHAAIRAIEKASRDPRGWGMALPCITEFWSVVTHPGSRGGGSPPSRARDFLRALIAEAGAEVWLSRHGSWERITKLAEDLGGQRPDIIGRAPVDTGAIGCIVLLGHTVPLPTCIQIDPHNVRQPQRRRNRDRQGRVSLRRQIVCGRSRYREPPASDRGRHKIGLDLRGGGGRPFAVGARAAGSATIPERASSTSIRGASGPGK